MELLTLNTVDNLSSVLVIVTVALAVIRDKLVWHTRLTQAEERAERWERIALEALTIGAKSGTKAAETTADLISALPDPAAEGR